MPIKNFFSGRKPEENDVAPTPSADEGMFEADFDGMQSLDMYADEDSAAGGFAALLQPDDAFSAQDTEQAYYSDDMTFDEDSGDGQNVGEAVFQNLFAEDAAGGEGDFFASEQGDFAQSGDDFFAASGDFAQENSDGGDFFAANNDFAQDNGMGDDFFAAQPEDYTQTVQGDDFFAAQPMEFEEANAQQTDDFFAAQQTEQPFADATNTEADFINLSAEAAVPQEHAVQVLPDATLEQTAPMFGFETAEQQPMAEPDMGVPFDIAVPEQTQSFLAEQQETPIELSTDPDYVQKRKYTPVFTQPIPSALDELRAGIVRPASPISSIAATQIPVVVTAAEAAAAEAAAKAAAEATAAQAAAEEQAAREAAERAAAETQASKFGYHEPSPAEMGFGYAPPVQENTYGYDNAQNGPISADEFHLPVTEDAPLWQENVAAQPEAVAAPQPEFSAEQGFETTPAEANAFAFEQEPQHTAFFDYENAPIESNPAYENANVLDLPVAPGVQDDFNAFGTAQEEYSSAETPADYASNLEAMFSNDDTYAAVDAIEQPYEQPYEAPTTYSPSAFDTATFDAPAGENGGFALSVPAFEDESFGEAAFADEELGADTFADVGFGTANMEQEGGSDAAFGFGAMQDDAFAIGEEAPTGEFDLSGDDYLGFDEEEQGAQTQNASAGNPFESEEWLAEGDYSEDAPKKAGHKFHDESDRPIKQKKMKPSGNGGGGNGKKNNLPLIIVLVVLVLAILGVVLYLLFAGKKDTPASSSMIPSSVASVPNSSSEPVSSAPPAVDPIPRDEWYLKLVNRQNVLSADFKIDTKNCSDGIPVDARMVDALNQMISDGNATGLKLTVASGYRTYDRQKTNYDYQVSQQIAAGKSKADAETAAALITAPPGASEHNLGLAVDIMSKTFTDYDSKYEETAEAKWLLENAANYGFILRYSKAGEAVTGFEYEPWHYRYVGVDQAKKIKESGLTLEDYLAQDAPTGIPTAGGEESASAADGASSAAGDAENAASSSSSAAQ